jgi:hypothetical protein
MPARDLGKAKFKHSELASHFALLIGGHGLVVKDQQPVTIHALMDGGGCLPPVAARAG